MPDITIADALRFAINVLRDSAESKRMPSGAILDESSVELHADAAETLEESLSGLGRREVLLPAFKLKDS